MENDVSRKQQLTTEVYREIGARIVVRRKAMGLTQEELAEKAGVSPQTISKAESGCREMTLKTIVGIAVALEVSVDYLLFGQSLIDRNASLEEKAMYLSDKNYRYVSELVDLFNEMDVSISADHDQDDLNGE